MTRRTRNTAIVFGGFVFLGLSLLLTKAFVGAGNERGAVLEVVRAQAGGDVEGVLRRLPACRRSAPCTRLVRERAERLARPGEVEILNFRPSVQVALTNRSGQARVAWRTDERPLPVVVQCVVVERHGPLTGGEVRLVSISNPIGGTASCGG